MGTTVSVDGRRLGQEGSRPDSCVIWDRSLPFLGFTGPQAFSHRAAATAAEGF